MLILQSVEDFLNQAKSPLGTSEWLTINQQMIDKFAEVTLDFQWIHVDSQRIIEESPYGRAIAHGYLILSLIPHFLESIFQVKDLDRIVNYSIDKMVYNSPVLVGSRLRMKAFLKSAKDLGEICLANIQCEFEIEGREEPVLEGNIKYLYYFKNK